jgi:hypothetical protein
MWRETPKHIETKMNFINDSLQEQELLAYEQICDGLTPTIVGLQDEDPDGCEQHSHAWVSILDMATHTNP